MLFFGVPAGIDWVDFVVVDVVVVSWLLLLLLLLWIHMRCRIRDGRCCDHRRDETFDDGI